MVVWSYLFDVCICVSVDERRTVGIIQEAKHFVEKLDFKEDRENRNTITCLISKIVNKTSPRSNDPGVTYTTL